MFFFFPKGQYPVAYTSITTKTSKKAIAEIGFESWMQNTAAYKSLVSALPQIQQADDKDKHFYASFFEDIRLESDGLNKKQIETIMLTGDNEATANKIAKELTVSSTRK